MYGKGWHGIHTTVKLPLPIEDVFAFFADAHNLERITPPELNFKITQKGPIHIEEGTLIRYELKLFGIPFKWLTRIARWQPPTCFIDEQLEGPYRVWHHTHTFTSLPEGNTLMHDVVRYRLPLWPLGELAYPFIAAQLTRIFAYRKKTILQILDNSPEVFSPQTPRPA